MPRSRALLNHDPLVAVGAEATGRERVRVDARRRHAHQASAGVRLAAAAVVISLLLVAYSIKRNTEEMETSNSNFLYQLDEQVTADLSREPQMAALFIKVEKGQELSDTEKFQYLNLQQLSLIHI